MKESLLALAAIGMAVVLLIHFGCIWVFGSFYITESNPFTLITETFLIIGILVFSLYCFVKELRRTE